MFCIGQRRHQRGAGARDHVRGRPHPRRAALLLRVRAAQARLGRLRWEDGGGILSITRKTISKLTYLHISKVSIVTPHRP